MVAAELAAHPAARVTDLASVKAGPLRSLQERGVDLTRYVGSHPMAGRERSGAVAARADLFAGQPWVVCPHAVSSPAAVADVRAVAVAVGGIVSELAAQDHDAAVALVSHVPQLLASLAAARLESAPPAALALSGPGAARRDTHRRQRPGAVDPDPRGQRRRRGEVLEAVRDDLARALDAWAPGRRVGRRAGLGARATVAGLVARGNAGQQRIPGKHGAPHTSYAAVPVVVPDRPGELARLLHDVGAAGVNLEDLRLEHSQGQPVGLAEVLVVPEAAAGLVAALRELGWTVHDAALS